MTTNPNVIDLKVGDIFIPGDNVVIRLDIEAGPGATLTPCEEPHLGLATTRELLEELSARLADPSPGLERVELDAGARLRSVLEVLSAETLDYRTAGDR